MSNGLNYEIDHLKSCCLLAIRDMPPELPNLQFRCECGNVIKSTFAVDHPAHDYMRAIHLVAFRMTEFSKQDANESASMLGLDRRELREDFGCYIYIQNPHSWFKAGSLKAKYRAGVWIVEGFLKDKYQLIFPTKQDLEAEYYSFLKDKYVELR